MSVSGIKPYVYDPGGGGLGLPVGPSFEPQNVRGDNKDDGKQNSVWGVTYKQIADGPRKGQVIIEGKIRAKEVFIDISGGNNKYSVTNIVDGGSYDLDKKKNGIIHFKYIIDQFSTTNITPAQGPSVYAATFYVGTTWGYPAPAPGAQTTFKDPLGGIEGTPSSSTHGAFVLKNGAASWQDAVTARRKRDALKPKPQPKPSPTPQWLTGDPKDSGKAGDVWGVTYKSDGKGNVIIEGSARAEGLLVYDQSARRWAYMVDNSKDDKNWKNDGVVRFRLVVKAGHTVQLFSVKKDAAGKVAPDKKIATFYTSKAPKRNRNTEGPLVLALPLGGAAAGGAGAGGIAVASGAAGVAAAVTAQGVRNPPRSKPKPPRLTVLESISAALNPIGRTIANSSEIMEVIASVSRSPDLIRHLSGRSELSARDGAPSAETVRSLQSIAQIFGKSAGAKFLLQLLLALGSGGVLTGIGALVGKLAGGKVLNKGLPATISLFTYSPGLSGEIRNFNGAVGAGPYVGVSPSGTTAANTNFSVSLALPQKAEFGKVKVGFGITLSWAIDTAEKNDTGSVGNKPSVIAGGFVYGLAGRVPPPILNPPTDQKKNRVKFYIGAETDFGAQVRYRPGREHKNQFIFAGWLNLLLTVALMNKKASSVPAFLVGPVHAPAKWQFIVPNTLPGGDSKPPAKKGPQRQFNARLSGFELDDPFWSGRRKSGDKYVHDLLVGAVLINTGTGRRHAVYDGDRARGKNNPRHRDYDIVDGKNDPFGVKMRYRAGTHTLKNPNEVIFAFGNKIDIHVQYDNLWGSKKGKVAPKLKKIYGWGGPNRTIPISQAWINKYLTATFVNGTVTLIKKPTKTHP